MKLKIVAIGATLILLAIPGYIAIPSLIVSAMNKLTFGVGPSDMSRQIFSQLGLPPIPDVNTMTTFTQDSFIGVIVAGLGMVAFGMISKKIPKSTPVKISLDTSQYLQEDKGDTNTKAIRLLQERLSKGEITSSQYQNLKKLLEEKR